MLEFVMFMNKRRLMAGLLIAAILFMVLYAVLYPKTVLTITREVQEATGQTTRLTCRLNTRGTMTILTDVGDSYKTHKTEVDKARREQMATLAEAVSAGKSADSPDNPYNPAAADDSPRLTLVIGEVMVHSSAASPDHQVEDIWALAELYATE